MPHIGRQVMQSERGCNLQPLTFDLDHDLDANHRDVATLMHSTESTLIQELAGTLGGNQFQSLIDKEDRFLTKMDNSTLPESPSPL